MSAPATPATPATVPPPLLAYAVEVQPVTHSSGQIRLTVTPRGADYGPVFCTSITVEVPIGDRGEDMFTKAPVIKTSRSTWAPSSYVSTVPALADGQGPTTVQRFVIHNQNPNVALVDTSFSVIITGNVNTVQSSVNGVKVKPQLTVAEVSGAALNAVAQALPQKIDLEKAHSLLLYIDSFYASKGALAPTTPATVGSAPAASTAPGTAASATAGTATEPTTKFRSGEPFKLSWESNGTNYVLYQDDKAVKLDADETTSHKLNTGINSDTTFVLQATGKTGAKLYASLTVMVSNPTYGPGLQPIGSILNSTIRGIDSYELRQALETRRGLEPPVENKLKNALAITSDEKVRTAFSHYCLRKFDYYEVWESPNAEQFKDLVNALYDKDLKKWLLLPSNSEFRFNLQAPEDPYLSAALQATSDPNLKAALQETNFPVLVSLLELPVIGTALQTAIQQLRDTVLIPLFDDEDTLKCFGHDEAIKMRAALADAKAKSVLDNRDFDLQKSLDTAYSLRVSNGTVIGNIVVQALSGDDSGLATLSFNGYSSNGDRLFNPGKARFRVGTDQRGTTDQFFIDTYSKGAASSKLALTITADGNVGVGTTSPTQKLDVTGNTIVNGNSTVTGEVRANAGLQFADRNTPTNYFEWYNVNGTASLYSSVGGANTISVLTNGYVGIGTTSPSFPLHIAAKGPFGSTSFGYLNSGGASVYNGGKNNVNVGIKADYAILAEQFWATSDARLKTVIGQSDHAADLALLRELRITDYTMRDRVQFGNCAFKKIIAQELEEIFPQAVCQHTGFLPDIYTRPSKVQRQGAALLISLPAGLPQAATAGQRLKLIGPAGEVLATLAEAAEAGSQQLLVSGANDLADTPDEVFVFGLEHPDVRTVDYEAVAMLHVSASQALARQVEEVQQQNAALNEQSRAQRTQFDEMQMALRLLQEQMAGLLARPSGVALPA